ncbi:hypothetical protein [Aquibacillus koreensis]|nr:hypothetical protein [Aquibacillus koreensis]
MRITSEQDGLFLEIAGGGPALKKKILLNLQKVFNNRLGKKKSVP